MKTLDWSVETLGRECNSTGLCVHFNKTRIASKARLIYLGFRERTNRNISIFLKIIIKVPCSGSLSSADQESYKSDDKTKNKPNRWI